MPLSGLDEFQAQAVASPGHTLVVAGPGAGKTRVLLARAEKLLEDGLPPERLFLLTFTVRAARELRERLAKPGVIVETFHALAYRLAREQGHAPKLEDEEDYTRLLTLAAGHPLEKEEIHLLIDEFQDLSPELVAFLRRFERACFFLVGDPAQAIYGFRGARPEVALDFARSLPSLKIHYLLRSYRVPEKILEAAQPLRDDFGLETPRLQATIANGNLQGLGYPNPEREAKGIAKIIAEALGGLQMERSRLGLSPGEVAVLARVRPLLAKVKNALQDEGIPVIDQDERQKVREEELKALLKEASWVRDLTGLLSSAKKLSTETKKEIEDLVSEAKDLEEALFRLRFLLWEKGVLKAQTAVNLLTIHQAKGLEFKVVILIGAEEGLLPFTFWPEVDEAEEKRLAYVALTRSAQTFFFTVAKKRFLYGRRYPGKISPYFSSLPFTETKTSPPPRRQKSLF